MPQTKEKKYGKLILDFIKPLGLGPKVKFRQVPN